MIDTAAPLTIKKSWINPFGDHTTLDKESEYNTLLLRLTPGDLNSSNPHSQFLPDLLHSQAALPAKQLARQFILFS